MSADILVLPVLFALCFPKVAFGTLVDAWNALFPCGVMVIYVSIDFFLTLVRVILDLVVCIFCALCTPFNAVVVFVYRTSIEYVMFGNGSWCRSTTRTAMNRHALAAAIADPRSRLCVASLSRPHGLPRDIVASLEPFLVEHVN